MKKSSAQKRAREHRDADQVQDARIFLSSDLQFDDVAQEGIFYFAEVPDSSRRARDNFGGYRPDAIWRDADRVRIGTHLWSSVDLGGDMPQKVSRELRRMAQFLLKRANAVANFDRDKKRRMAKFARKHSIR